MLAARAATSAFECGTLRTFLGDFFSFGSVTNTRLRASAGIFFLLRRTAFPRPTAHSAILDCKAQRCRKQRSLKIAS